MIGANWEFTDDDRQYHAVWDSQVNGPEWWRVTRRDDGKSVTVPFTDEAGIEIERREVERRALEKFKEFDR